MKLSEDFKEIAAFVSMIIAIIALPVFLVIDSELTQNKYRKAHAAEAAQIVQMHADKEAKAYAATNQLAEELRAAMKKAGINNEAVTVTKV